MDNYYLYGPLKRSSELYDADFRTKVSSYVQLAYLMTYMYLLVLIGLALFVYVPMIRKLSKEAKSAWKLVNLIPSD